MNLVVFLAAMGATAMEMAEAALVVLVVVRRGHGAAALAGSVVAAALVAAAAAVAGFATLRHISVDLLRQVVGGGLLAVGLLWLLRSVVSPAAAGLELDKETAAARGWSDRGALAAGLISAKAVGVESTEAAVLVVAIGAPHQALASAAAGASVAAVLVVLVAIRLERRLRSLAQDTLSRIGGTVLAIVGCAWLLEGLHLGVAFVALIVVVTGAVVVVAWAVGLNRRAPLATTDEATSHGAFGATAQDRP